MGESFQNVARGGVEWLECPALSRLPWLLHAFTTRRDGEAFAEGFSLPYPGGNGHPAADHNWDKLRAAVGARGFRLAALRQIHSDRIVRVNCDGASQQPRYISSDRARPLPEGQSEPCGDALMISEPGVLVAVRTADCVPILVADPHERAVAAIHCGWRGALDGIVEKTILEMRRAFGSQPQRLVAAVGPSIRSCCYQVGDEVISAFRDRFPGAEQFFTGDDAVLQDDRALGRSAPAKRLDLIAVTRRQFASAGVAENNLHISNFCTACRTDLFYSYRKEGPRAGRMAAIIGIRPEKSG